MSTQREDWSFTKRVLVRLRIKLDFLLLKLFGVVRARVADAFCENRMKQEREMTKHLSMQLYNMRCALAKRFVTQTIDENSLKILISLPDKQVDAATSEAMAQAVAQGIYDKLRQALEQEPTSGTASHFERIDTG